MSISRKLARETIVIEIGYDRAKYGFDGSTCSVLSSINEQSKGHRHGGG